MKPKLTDAERKLRKLANQAKYRKANPEKIKESNRKRRELNPGYDAAYYAANSEKIKKRTAEYAKANPERTRAYKTAWEKANPDKVRASQSRWWKANPEKTRGYGLTYAAKHPEKLREKYAAYRLANPGKRSALQARRTASQLLATPPWADLDAIKAIYIQAAQLGLEVDHIVPLQGKNVCGLHVAHNLQLLTKSENSRKGNSHST